jgi:hypothetical protein
MHPSKRANTLRHTRATVTFAPHISALACSLSMALLHCGTGDSAPIPPSAEGAATLAVDQRTSERLEGRFAGRDGTDPATLEFVSTRSTPLSGEVELSLGSLQYTLRYDYGAGREVIADGQGAAIDRQTQHLLLDAIDAVRRELGPNDPGLPLHEQMLFAGLALLEESGGMPLDPLRFPLGADETEKSLGNDGVTCIQRGDPYEVSFDDSNATVEGQTVTADADECNGLCGPGCSQLTPWKMWTLDCLEHDTCCQATGDHTLCWTPLGECGDEYADAEADFLRGFDPLKGHCSG